MANCKKGQGSADLNAEVRRANAAAIRSAEGITARLEVRNDLTGNWRNADATKFYAGIVPIIGNSERYDLSFNQYDLLVENIPSFPSGDEVEFFTPQDALHQAARTAWREGITLSEWLKAILTAMGSTNGGTSVEVTLKALTYAAHNRNGGTYQAAILGAEKK